MEDRPGLHRGGQRHQRHPGPAAGARGAPGARHVGMSWRTEAEGKPPEFKLNAAWVWTILVVN